MSRAPLVAQLRPSEIPLSYAQRRLWFLERLEGGGSGSGGSAENGGARNGSAYVIPLAVRLAGVLDRAALEGALCDLIERHESLRTVFPERLGVPRQLILAASAARVELDVIAADEARFRGFCRRMPGGALICRASCRCGRICLSLRRNELGRNEAGEAEHVLLVVLHHIAGDGWSLGPLSRDLAAYYRARCAGGAAELAPLAVQYADYTLWQQAVLGDGGRGSSALSRQLEFWKATLKDLPDQIDLPGDRPRPAVVEPSRRRVPLSIDAGTARGAVGAGAGQPGRACSWCCRRRLRAADAARGGHRHRRSAARSRAAATRRWTS